MTWPGTWECRRRRTGAAPAAVSVDGEVRPLDLGLAAPSRDAAHIARLLALRLERLGGGFDAEFGFEAAAMHVLVAEPLAERQEPLGMDEEARPAGGVGQLVDRLRQRLGAASRAAASPPQESHIPERAERDPLCPLSPLFTGRGSG